MTDRLVSRVVERVRSRGSDGATVEGVTVGDRAVLVELGGPDGTTAGLAHRPAGAPPATDGADVDGLLSRATGPATDGTARVGRALGIATANALSAPLLAWRDGDPMALLDPSVETIATVGLFRPAFRKFSAVDVRVIEQRTVDDVATPDDVRVAVYSPDETATAMDGAEVVFVTGSTLIYGGIERYLDAAPPEATVVVVGSTASFLPDPLFDAGVDIVAGVTVVDAQQARRAVRAGACGTDLHEAGVEKVYVATESVSGVRIDAES